jgi:hypothetical protein
VPSTSPGPPTHPQATKRFKAKSDLRTLTAWGLEIRYPSGLLFRQEQDGETCLYQQYRRTHPDGSYTLWYPHRPLEAVTRWPGRECRLQHDRAIGRAALSCASSLHWHERWGPDAQVVLAPGTSEASLPLPRGHRGARACAACLPRGALAAATFGDGTRQTLYSNGTRVTVQTDGTVRSSAISPAGNACYRRRFTWYRSGDSLAEVGGRALVPCCRRQEGCQRRCRAAAVAGGCCCWLAVGSCWLLLLLAAAGAAGCL